MDYYGRGTIHRAPTRPAPANYKLLYNFHVPADINQPHRRSIRYPGYDYRSSGAYFITLVTHGHRCIFGKVTQTKMHLYHLGEIVHNCWLELPSHFPGLENSPFVVMPNHLHGIITINDSDRRGTIYRAPTTEKFGKPISGSLATIIRTYKAAVTRIAKRDLHITPVWQRNYHEHIIRNDAELDNITQYILSNPDNWVDDPEYHP